MHRTHSIMATIAIAILGLAIYGCTQPTTTSTEPADNSAETVAEEMDHSGHDHGDHEAGQSDMDKMKAELAKLPETDRLSAEKQHMCPVSGEMLGTMGAPLKVTAKGHDVWLCCEGCKDKLLANPDEYVAKLAK
jgi:hypothetical protein